MHDCKLLDFPDEISRIIDTENVKILRYKQNSNVIERLLLLCSEIRTKVFMTKYRYLQLTIQLLTRVTSRSRRESFVQFRTAKGNKHHLSDIKLVYGP